jgi:hypothetical protein
MYAGQIPARFGSVGAYPILIAQRPAIRQPLRCTDPVHRQIGSVAERQRFRLLPDLAQTTVDRLIRCRADRTTLRLRPAPARRLTYH